MDSDERRSARRGGGRAGGEATRFLLQLEREVPDRPASHGNSLRLAPSGASRKSADLRNMPRKRSHRTIG